MQIPNFIYPFKKKFPITSGFGDIPSNEAIKIKFKEWGWVGHIGIDFGCPEGTEILAIDNGKIIKSGINGDYGNCVIIEHSWGASLYAHLKECKVKEGDKIIKGKLVGLSGKTGAAFGAHLHFAVKPNNPDPNNGHKGYIDPTPHFINKKVK